MVFIKLSLSQGWNKMICPLYRAKCTCCRRSWLILVVLGGVLTGWPECQVRPRWGELQTGVWPLDARCTLYCPLTISSSACRTHVFLLTRYLIISTWPAYPTHWRRWYVYVHHCKKHSIWPYLVSFSDVLKHILRKIWSCTQVTVLRCVTNGASFSWSWWQVLRLLTYTEVVTQPPARIDLLQQILGIQPIPWPLITSCERPAKDGPIWGLCTCDNAINIYDCR